jgi:hypothetical protein
VSRTGRLSMSAVQQRSKKKVPVSSILFIHWIMCHLWTPTFNVNYEVSKRILSHTMAQSIPMKWTIYAM